MGVSIITDISAVFWAASIPEIQSGFMHDAPNKRYTCLICGESFAEGTVYPQEGTLHLAESAVEWHVAQKHGSVFAYLLDMNRALTGLTDIQRDLLKAWKAGKSDKEIAAEMHIGSTSTVRNHRFRLKEREKQAKVFLAIMGLLDEVEKGERFVTIHKTANMVDERFAITESEKEGIVKKYFRGGNGPLERIPLKEKRKIVVLQHIMLRFTPGRRYTEKEINEELKTVYADFVTLRRLLIEYGFMDRERDCSAYWVKL